MSDIARYLTDRGHQSLLGARHTVYLLADTRKVVASTFNPFKPRRQGATFQLEQGMLDRVNLDACSFGYPQTCEPCDYQRRQQANKQNSQKNFPHFLDLLAALRDDQMPRSDPCAQREIAVRYAS